ncbi:low molecular weight phosphatase family protein [Listeria marthii]|uniref:Low molecular weight phosphatase family protein n=1 Tax=Listeria marthii TaxID=529731 RepID=A0A842CSY9_9LIST|nr:low molecular weight phosphatase family protein [Listeria marthii]MBC1969502.1 low molecular weight phosphatase family protein [Listeria marthii]MBC1979331.1 low molecular weight phosphatase family protein [Listeria marthii]MBC1998164.1 low molecular weight phosphatase family protein [Listeria marthii]MBC1999928.1 low molecular weight phosphatase family protein [Listeria marthii]MBC2072643.1 low molecular weight phosphatase family protein [Listeria marthii]
MTQKLIYFLSQTHIRSAIAEAWAKRLSLSNVKFISGSWHKSKATPFIAEALNEFAIEPPESLSYSPSSELLADADLIVTIYDSAHETAPNFPANIQDKIIYWDIDDPEQEIALPKKWASYQEVCDNIALSVKNLEHVLIEA